MMVNDMIFKIGMQIEFDADKNEKNIKKHGYSLCCAVDILYSLLLMQDQKVIISDEYEYNDEMRCKAMAEYEGRIVFFVFTMRGDNMRLISFRDASEKETQERD